MRSTSRVTAVACALVTTGCAVFGANLPPGITGGTFVDQPRGAVPLSADVADSQRALDEAARAHAERQADVLETLLERSLNLRTTVVEEERAMRARVETGTGLGLKDMDELREVGKRALELDAILYALWTTYRGALPHGSEPDPYAPARAASLLSPETRAMAGLLALAAELVRLDNIQAIVDVLDPHPAIIHALNVGDDLRGYPAEGYDRLIGALRDPDRRALLASQLDAVAGARERLDTQAQTDFRVARLLDLVDESRTANDLRTETEVGRRALFLWTVISRSGWAVLGVFLPDPNDT